MKHRVIILPVLLASAALAGCDKTTGTMLLAPYADAYKATYASAAKNTVEQVFAADKKIQGGTAPVMHDYGTNPATASLGDPQKFEVEKTADGYIMRVAGEEFTLTDAEYTGGGYEMIRKNRYIASLYAMNDPDTNDPDTKAALASASKSMVPLNYYAKVEEGAAPANPDSQGAVTGYTILGAETDPSAMPKAGKATYSGYGRIDAHAKSVNYDLADQVENVNYRGDASFEADFDKGEVSGALKITDRRVRKNDSNTGWLDVSGDNAEIMLTPAKIVDNGFASDLEANAAGNLLMDADGISDDTEATAVGRFYGEDAGEIGAVIAGDGSTHVINGVIFGDRN